MTKQERAEKIVDMLLSNQIDRETAIKKIIDISEIKYTEDEQEGYTYTVTFDMSKIEPQQIFGDIIFVNASDFDSLEPDVPKVLTDKLQEALDNENYLEADRINKLINKTKCT